MIRIVVLSSIIGFVSSQYYFGPQAPNSGLIGFRKAQSSDLEAANYNSNGAKGNKGYSSREEFEKGLKGFHDREGLKKQFAVDAGNRNAFQHKDGYYGFQNQDQTGTKSYNFADNGRYAKGHRTKGQHNVHDLNEYKKKTDFFDEKHDEKFKEDHGGYHVDRIVGHGDVNKGNYQKAIYLLGNFGRYGQAEKGKEFSEKSGFDKEQGVSEFIKNGLKFDKLKGNEDFRNYGFLIKH